MLPSTHFVLRTPLLPLETFAAWHTAADPRRYLRDLIARPEIVEALFLATPALAEIVERWRQDPAIAHDVELSLARYLARMAGRCTPFGLFSAVSTGTVGTTTSLFVASQAEYQRRTRVDNDFLFALVEELARQPAIRASLRYRPNSSLYSVAGRLRYAQARLAGRERTYHLVSVDATPYLVNTLERARAGARQTELADALVADDLDVTSADAAAYIEELVAAQILAPDLGIAVTGSEPIDAVIDQLETGGGDNIAGRLRDVRAAIKRVDARGVGTPTRVYVDIAETLRQLPVTPELGRLFQVDAVKPAVATLAPGVVKRVARAIESLQRVQRTPATSLDHFRAAFVDRYEGREVPLVEVLDEDCGIGFESDTGPGSAGAPLLEGLSFPGGQPDEGVHWGAFERYMLDRLLEHRDEIELGEEDLKRLETRVPVRLPDAFHAMFRLQGNSERPQILFEAASGPSGVRLFGRFCHASADIDRIVRDHLRAEQALRPDAIFAEVIHLNEGRIGNVVCRPVLRDYEIPFLGLSGAPEHQQLAPDDLLVSVRDRIVLRSRRLGREVVPRLSTAHNFRLRSLPIYRFLCALQDTTTITWSWSALASSARLPRVRIGDVIVQRATWNLRSREIAPVTNAVRTGKPAQIAAAVDEIRDRMRLPRHVVISDGDNELPIDLDNPLLMQVFADEVSGRTHATLKEQFPAPDASPVRGPEGTFANELVVPFTRRGASVAPAVIAPLPRVRRSFPPGSSWLYAKLYTGVATADRVLREAIAPVVRAARADITQWFFVRYRDPDEHVRVRFAGHPSALTSRVLPMLVAAIEPVRLDGTVSKVQFDTYERETERYGGDAGIELVEQLFCIDSEAVLGIVELLEGDAAADARWRLALRGSESLLTTLGIDANERHDIFRKARDTLAREHAVNAAFFAPIGKRFRAERTQLEALFAPDPARDAGHDLAPGLELLRARDEKLRTIAAELRVLDDARQLVPLLREIASSLVHMHVNRLLHASHRAQELVLYDLLRRLHEARGPRSRKRGADA